MEGLKKGFLAKAYSSKEKGDGSKKNQDVSENLKPLNVIQKTADAQTKPSQDKAQQSEGNSSSLFTKGLLLDKKTKRYTCSKPSIKLKTRGHRDT
jgi:hypothetical protein